MLDVSVLNGTGEGLAARICCYHAYLAMRPQVAAGEATWDDIRGDLAAQYLKAGVHSSATLVKAL